jgi:hypothetical protein
MSANPYVVRRVARLRSSQRRAVAFLKCTTDRDIDAELAFNELPPERERELRDRFDFWIGGGIKDQYFHGWPAHRDYEDCFTFKWRERGENHRLYGFLIHPKPSTDPRFQVCILISHAMKTTWETDPRHLEMARRLRSHPLVLRAVQHEFPEHSTGARQWLN